MLLGIFGDIHFTNRGPGRRKDDFFQTQMRKFRQGLDIFQQNHCDIIIQPGDLCDSPAVSNFVKASVISTLKVYNQKLYVISGQHDISGHSLTTLPNSPLNVFQSAGVITLLNSEGLQVEDGVGCPSITLYGCNFGEKISVPKKKSDYNILIIHAMIGDRELYPNQEITKPEQFLRNNPDFSLTICGDYHYRFAGEYKGRYIVNAGCLVRKTISTFDLEHEPAVIIFDTETGKYTTYKLDIEPVADIFNLIRSDSSGNSNLSEFINNLKSTRMSSGRCTWRTILDQVIKEKNSSVGVIEVIDKHLEKVQQNG